MHGPSASAHSQSFVSLRNERHWAARAASKRCCANAIGAVIRNRRRELKLDQSQLARRIGATRQWLIAIEKGKDTAELGMVLRTLAALDLELDARAKDARVNISMDLEPLPRLDIDTIADANVNRDSGVGMPAASRARTKAATLRRRGKGRRLG
jgi:HTH-type transcriptional regulator/antitoxin HipB